MKLYNNFEEVIKKSLKIINNYFLIYIFLKILFNLIKNFLIFFMKLLKFL